MVKSCCAYNCNNVWRPNQGIQYHKFPLKSPALLEQWVKATQLENFTPTPYKLICSQHFKEEDYSESTLSKKRLKPDVVPSVFDFSRYNQQHKSKRRKLERADELKVEDESELSSRVSVSNVQCYEDNNEELVGNGDATFIDDTIVKDENELSSGMSDYTVAEMISSPSTPLQLSKADTIVKDESELSSGVSDYPVAEMICSPPTSLQLSKGDMIVKNESELSSGVSDYVLAEMICSPPTSLQLGEGGKRKKEESKKDKILNVIAGSSKTLTKDSENENRTFAAFIANELSLFKNESIKRRCKRAVLKVLLAHQEEDENS